MNPEPELRNIMKFLTNLEDLTETNAERRVREVIEMGQNAAQTYSLKETTRRFNTNVHRYTEKQLVWIQEHMKEVLHYFGYSKVPSDLEN